MALKPQDVALLAYLGVRREEWTYPGLARALRLSASEVHAAVKRATLSHLFNPASRRPARAPFLEFLEHGVRYVYPVEHGPLVRGVPTAHAAPPLNSKIVGTSEPPPVWPDPEGDTRGQSWAPLYPSLPQAARADSEYYAAMALVDALRGGAARERKLALEELRKRIE